MVSGLDFMPVSRAMKAFEQQLMDVVVLLRLQTRLPVWLLWLGVVLLAYETAQVSWHLIERPVAVPVLPAATPVEGVRTGGQQAYGALIGSRHLFGEQMVAPPMPAGLPEVRTDLLLKGVFATGNRHGAAIIQEGSEQHYYVVGDALTDGTFLREVHRDHVVLERGGRLENLALPSNELPSSAPVVPSASASASTAQFSNPENGRLLRQYRDILRNEPQSLMGLLNAVPVREGTKVMGSRISPGQDPTLLGRFGLQAGDVVTSLNGLALDGQMKGMDVLKSLGSAQQLSITLVRNGQPLSMQYQIGDE